MRARKATGSLLALALLVGLMSPVSADPSEVGELRSEAARLEAQIESQGQRLSMAQEEYNHAVYERERLEAQLASVRSELRAAEERWAELKELLGERARVLYKHRGALAESWFGLSSIGEFVRARAFAGSVMIADTDLLYETDTARREMEQVAERVAGLRQTAAAKEQELAGRRVAVQRELAAHQDVLGEVRGEIAEVLEAERQRELEEARRRAEEQARRQERAAQEEARRAVQEEARRTTQAPRTGTDSAGEEATDSAGEEATDSAGEEAPATGGSNQNQEAPRNAPPPARPEAAAALDAARAQLGTPYCWGGSGPDCFDCSGLTQHSWRQAGVEIPRSSRAQYSALPKVPRDQIQPGDLLFFGNPIHHVGIYEGGGVMIEAPYTGEDVRRRSINRSDWHGAARP